MKHIIKMVWREWFLRRKNKEYLSVDQCNNNSAKIAVEKLGQQEEGSNSELSWDIQSIAVKPKLKTKRKSRYVRGLQALISCGAACLVLGIFTLLLQPYDLIFKIAARLTEGSETYDLWKKPPVELYLRVFVFNVTNREEFLTKGEKLKVEEVGPFVYREVLEQTQVEFLKNGSVNSIPRHPLYLVPELSGADENATVIVPNVALLGMGNILRTSSIFHKLGFNILARQVGAEPLIEMTAREFMFGYDDPLVGLGNKFLTSWIYFDKLGLIDRMYDFGDDIINSYTGEDEFNKTGLLHTYNGMTHLPHWGTSDKCNRIDGASGCSKFANRIGINDSITIYHKPLCRPMSLYRIAEERLEGMKAYRYRFMADAMDNGQLNPEYECYCQGVNEGNCLPHGLIDITPCFYGFPIALSYPHFYSGDPSLLEHVDGLSPDQSLHDSFFLIQPDVGLPMEVAVRTQINIALKTMPGIAKVSKFENKVLPLLWSESRMYSLPRSLMTRFVMYFSILPMFQQAGIYCLISFGIAALLAGVLGIVCRDETGKPGLRNETPYRSLLTISSSSSSASDTSETSDGSTETCSDV